MNQHRAKQPTGMTWIRFSRHDGIWCLRALLVTAEYFKEANILLLIGASVITLQENDNWEFLFLII